MNSEIKISNSTKFLFIVNIFLLFMMFLFKSIFSYLEYYYLIVNIEFIINLFILLGIVVFNIIVLIKQKEFKLKRFIITLILFCTFYLFSNILIMNLLNKSYENKYNKISDQLITYCKAYDCETYKITKNKEIRTFNLTKTYLDYNDSQNKINILTKYNTNNVIIIKVIIYSKNDSFSANLLKDNINSYLLNFGLSVNADMINRAFDNRFNGTITESVNKYRVTEIYEKSILKELKTEIIFYLD